MNKKSMKLVPYLFTTWLSTLCTFAIASGLPGQINTWYLFYLSISAFILLIIILIYNWYENFGKTSNN